MLEGMALVKPARVQDNKVVMTKLSRDEFIRLQSHCVVKNESVNSVIRKAVLNEVDSPIPHMLAGKNVFVYNRYKDNFSWSVMLDSGLRVDVEDDLPAEYVSQLLEELKRAVDERETYIKKQSKGSVAVPSRLVRSGL